MSATQEPANDGVFLRDRVIVITGAAQGLGAAYAKYCAKLGAIVTLVDVDEDALLAVHHDIIHAGGRGFVEVADVADAGALEALAERIHSRYSRLDGWVNNAGVQVMDRIDETTPSDIEKMVRVNVIGTIFGTRAAARVMRTQGSGSIVNITSGAQNGIPDLSVYGATKGAVASHTYAAALDLAQFGIRVNALSPMGNTQMAWQHLERMTHISEQEFMQTVPPPENNAAAIAFLLSDEAIGVSGQVIRVDAMGVSLVNHPRIMKDTVALGKNWSFETFAAAFETSLRTSMVQLGGGA